MLGADGDVAAGHRADSTAKGMAVDPGEGGLRHLPQCAHQCRQAQCVVPVFRFAGRGHAPHPVQVGARGERAALAGEHEGTQVVAAGQLVQGGGEFVDQPVVEGVVQRRAGQCKVGNVLVDIQLDVAHSRYPVTKLGQSGQGVGGVAGSARAGGGA